MYDEDMVGIFHSKDKNLFSHTSFNPCRAWLIIFFTCSLVNIGCGTRLLTQPGEDFDNNSLWTVLLTPMAPQYLPRLELSLRRMGGCHSNPSFLKNRRRVKQFIWGLACGVTPQLKNQNSMCKKRRYLMWVSSTIRNLINWAKSTLIYSSTSLGSLTSITIIETHINIWSSSTCPRWALFFYSPMVTQFTSPRAACSSFPCLLLVVLFSPVDKMFYDTFSGTTIKIAREGSLLEGLRLSIYE
jgi:hypothetical protein